MVGDLPGAGNSTEVLHYALLDDEAHAEVLYYRLRQTDTDGTSTVSDVRVVHMPQRAEGLRLYPDPCDGRFALVWPGGWPSGVHYLLVDATGRTLALTPDNGPATEARFEVPPLAAGIYRLQVLAQDRPLAVLPVVIR